MSSTPRWLLSRTLKRKPQARPLELDDVKYLFAAYRKGAFGNLIKDRDMDAKAFELFVLGDLLAMFHNAWVIIGKTPKGEIPIGVALGFWPHPTHPVQVMILDSLVWFPWASHRNRIEGAVSFINEERKDIPMLGFVREEDMGFFNMIARHGIIRRVGTSYNVFGGERAAIYETREANG